VENSHFELGLFLLALSYVVGHIFYRRDPKTPDINSFLRLYHDWETKPNKEETIEKAFAVSENSIKKGDIEFPYDNMKYYLKYRGLTHLCDLVPWVPEEKPLENCNTSNTIKRSKHYINVLKIRMAYLIPRKCGNITRNEAHVRLMSSIWYITKFFRDIDNWLGKNCKYFSFIEIVRLFYHIPDNTLSAFKRNMKRIFSRLKRRDNEDAEQKLSLKKILFSTAKQFSLLVLFLMVGLSIIGLLYIMAKCAKNAETLRWFKMGLGFFSGPFVILCSYVLSYTIEKFFHYQRLREVIYVLELAYFVSIKDNSLLEGLPLQQNKQKVFS
jgi:hypothetical protein